jgi:hypothetical protein
LGLRSFLLQLPDYLAQVQHEFLSEGIVPACFSRTFFLSRHLFKTSATSLEQACAAEFEAYQSHFRWQQARIARPYIKVIG